MVEVALLQRLSCWDSGSPDATLLAVGFSCRYFALQARRQVFFFVAPVLRSGPFSQPSRGLTQRRGQDIEGKGRTAAAPFIAVSGIPITGSTMNLPQPHGQWRHPARASRPGSRDPRSHVARPLQRPLDGSRWWCWQSSQFSCLRCHFRCSPVCSGDHKLCVRTRRGSLVRANRTRRDLPLLRIVLKDRRRDGGITHRPGPGPVALSRSSLRADLRVSLSPRVVPRPTLRDALQGAGDPRLRHVQVVCEQGRRLGLLGPSSVAILDRRPEGRRGSSVHAEEAGT